MAQSTGCGDFHQSRHQSPAVEAFKVLCVVTQAVEQFGIHICYGDLLHSMHRALKSMKAGKGGGGGMSALLSNGLSMDGILMVSQLHHSHGGAVVPPFASPSEIMQGA